VVIPIGPILDLGCNALYYFFGNVKKLHGNALPEILDIRKR
jgi:hypothetical protein